MSLRKEDFKFFKASGATSNDVAGLVFDTCALRGLNIVVLDERSKSPKDKKDLDVVSLCRKKSPKSHRHT